MKTSIIKIGNSKGIRIPKVLLEESKLGPKVELELKDGKIIIAPVINKKPKALVDEGILLSYSALAKEWNSPEEDEAWAYLQ
ncbi:MAG TPA: AbrB/MazE/SpoVT family DNA-binding domain-containing protein [Candidatus Saccharimonadales bacterium]|nr:AbrB/MazE/SpoVT family DNA-binding domain-containing protein [Candidatus Saccharimonadales bacterium]